MNLQKLAPFELRQICYFMTVVQAGNNFSEAAYRLGIKQPPLSQSIQALEKSLSADPKAPNVKLFDRSKRPIELTEAGQVFWQEAQLALTHLERAIIHAQQASQGQIGRLNIGLNNAIANSILPEMLKEFQNQFPNVELELHEVTIQQELSMLRSRELDVIFQRSPSFSQNDPDLRFQPILDEYFVVALPASHPLTQRRQISLIDLSQEPFIIPSLELLPFYKEVILLCRKAGFEPEVVSNASVTGIVALLSLVAAERGIAILPNHVQALKRDGILYRTVQDAKLNRETAVVWRQNDHSIVLLNFLNVINEIMGLPLIDSW